MSENRYSKIEKFEDLIAWQEARLLTNKIYDATQKTGFAHDRNLARQLQRASVSIMSNIAEGFERNTAGDYLRFLAIAKGSCGEVRCQLYIALDRKYLSIEDFNNLRSEAVKVSKIIAGLAAAIARKRNS